MQLNTSMSKNMDFARREGKRIAYYRGDILSDQEFWENQWAGFQAKSPELFYAPFLKGHLGYGVLASVLLKYLSKDGRILEAGCGLAQYVVALRARGYDCVGVDFADETVKKVKTLFPDLPVQKGDVLALPIKNDSLSAYISLGVVEHFKEGPLAAIQEAHRVLKANGLMLISVPQAFKWRRQLANSEGARIPERLVFYQYAFPSGELREALTKVGFAVLAEYGYSVHYALRLRFSWFRKLLKAFPKLAGIDLILDRTFLGRENARMRMYVARKL